MKKGLGSPGASLVFPQSSPRERTPLFFEMGWGDSIGKGEVVEVKDEGMQAKGPAKYISV